MTFYIKQSISMPEGEGKTLKGSTMACHLSMGAAATGNLHASHGGRRATWLLEDAPLGSRSTQVRGCRKIINHPVCPDGITFWAVFG